MPEVAELMARNTLLGELPDGVRDRLCPQLESVRLDPGAPLREPGMSLDHCYFPVTALISLYWRMQNGATAEVALTGREGVVGVELLMGRRSMAYGERVQIGGWALRVSAQALQMELAHDARFLRALVPCALSLIEQMSQTAACNRLHDLEQRLCRRLLLNQDRAQSESLEMTHDSLAQDLGVQREAVTHVAGRLREAGLIRYARGRIVILERRGLMLRSCECYEAAPTELPLLRGRQASAFGPAQRVVGGRPTPV